MTMCSMWPETGAHHASLWKDLAAYLTYSDGGCSVTFDASYGAAGAVPEGAKKLDQVAGRRSLRSSGRNVRALTRSH